MNEDFVSVMDGDIRRLVKNACSVARRYPRSLLAFARLSLYQKKAAKLRAGHRASGLTVPAFMIVSVTRRCNLNCKGCYSHVAAASEASGGRRSELDAERLARVIDEAAALGVSFVLLAGGEPLVRARDIFAMAKKHPDVVFPVFTNGTLLDEDAVRAFGKCRNLIPVLSIEGGEASTDGRRGSGTFGRASHAMEILSRAGIFFGVSFTVMKNNLREVASREFVSAIHESGAGIFFYNEYTPIETGTESLCIDAAGRGWLLDRLREFRREFPALFLAFPGDEDRYGGCMSSGRGFVHVAPDGRLEACPFAPFGDSDAGTRPLAEALRSPLLAAIRAHHGELSETAGGCALWNKREWAEGLVAEAARSAMTD